MSKFQHKKSLGQNFLYQREKVAQVVEAMNPTLEEAFIEIGPGTGYLTEQLLPKVKTLTCIEIDRQAIEILKTKFADKTNIEIIYADFLKYDLKKFCLEAGIGQQKLKVAGNIPYYITTPIIEKLIEHKHLISKAYLMVQKEVAERIISSEGSKVYGSLSVFCQYHADCKILLNIDRGNFYPVPEVDSAFIELNFEKKEKVETKNEELFFKIVRAGFSQRRKMFINNLKRVFDTTENAVRPAFEKCDIELKARIEDVSIKKLAQLSNIMLDLKIQ
ncbi:MAG: 16S rRNA (adenine(1518)-N(6)/adenine(1519)-N(6))-dimethyltransferase RsmA [bacterium]